MRTYRGGTGWDDAVWRAATTGTADLTRWTYGTTTGLLLAKTDANNAAVTYAYDLAGRRSTRTWARGVVTTYAYDPATGDLTGTSYSDGTPAVSNTFSALRPIQFTVARPTSGGRSLPKTRSQMRPSFFLGKGHGTPPREALVRHPSTGGARTPPVINLCIFGDYPTHHLNPSEKIVSARGFCQIEVGRGVSRQPLAPLTTPAAPTPGAPAAGSSRSYLTAQARESLATTAALSTRKRLLPFFQDPGGIDKIDAFGEADTVLVDNRASGGSTELADLEEAQLPWLQAELGGRIVVIPIATDDIDAPPDRRPP